MPTTNVATNDWHHIEDMTERRRLQNRIAQRIYRAKHKNPPPQNANEKERSSRSSSSQGADNGFREESRAAETTASHGNSASSGPTLDVPDSQVTTLEAPDAPSKPSDIMVDTTDLEQDLLSWPTPALSPFDLLVLPDSVTQEIYAELGVLPADTLVSSKKNPMPLRQCASPNAVPISHRIDANNNHEGPSQDKSALHLAAENGHEQTVRLLLDRGFDAASQDKSGRTPLHLSASNGHDSVVRVLTGATTAHLEQRDETGSTALHIAVAKGNYEIVRLLLSKGADISAKIGHDFSG